MKKQNQIKRTLSQPASINHVRELLQYNPDHSRTKLAEALCDQFEFYDTRGQPQLSGCYKALRDLEAANYFAAGQVPNLLVVSQSRFRHLQEFLNMWVRWKG
jgi:hypothetical protein